MNYRYTGYEGSTLWSVDAIETIDFIQQANFESFKNTVIGMIGNTYDASKVYVLWGCVNSGSGSNYNISAGAVFYNGEVYTVDATSFTASGTAVGTMTETDNGVGILFSDNVSRNILKIRKFVLADGASGSGTSGTNGDFGNFKPLKAAKVALYSFIADYTFYTGTHTTASLTTPNDGITRTYILEISVGLNITAKDTGTLGQADAQVQIWNGASELNFVELQGWSNNANSGHFTKNISFSANVKAIATLGPNTTIDFKVEDVASNGGTQIVQGYATMLEWG